jgi:hypothetical protein
LLTTRKRMRQPHKVVIADAGFEQCTAEQWHVRKELRWQDVQVKTDIEIDNAVGEEVVIDAWPGLSTI